MRAAAIVLLGVAVQLAQAAICKFDCSPYGQSEERCNIPTYTTCAVCLWDDDASTDKCKSFDTSLPVCPDCDKCLKYAHRDCPKLTNEVACTKTNTGSCTVCEWSNGKCGMSTSACSKTCSDFSTKTSCEDAAATCSCSWDASDAKCESNKCLKYAHRDCPKLTNEVACTETNAGSCTVCKWSNGKCGMSTSACSKTCSDFSTKTSCEDAAATCSCSWDASDAKCESNLENIIEDGLKLFVIIIIVMCVVAVLIIVACIVCCCCMGASAASAMSSPQSHKGAIIDDSEMRNY
eukprot:TRINITY_DN3785_c0_g2_i1.p2 TRINITY_DN3785_c0_g2~~TRINITY_DN3785_c0_g2_i1.p2  ORF type:complete len:292 (+),score=55.34 TRINITY_DN3785_c0_g2_i1:62-937(+)